MRDMVPSGNGNGFWRSPLVTAIGAAAISGVTAVIIMGQRVAVLQSELATHLAGQAAIETRVADLDTHGSRQLASMESRIKSTEDRNIEEDRRLATVEASMAALNIRLVLTEDRLASCQQCHMTGGAKTLTDHLQRNRAPPAPPPR